MRKHPNATHGMSKSSEFAIWVHMRQRCSNPNDVSYKHYGAKGIKVCDEWSSFENFYRDMGPRPSDDLSIERNDVNGDYTRSNCKLATDAEQSRNKRTNVFVNVNGERMIVTDAARVIGISRETIKSRVSRGMTLDDALMKPSRNITTTRRNETIEYNGISDNASGWASRTGIPYKTLLYRLNAGWDVSIALTKPIRKW